MKIHVWKISESQAFVSVQADTEGSEGKACAVKREGGEPFHLPPDAHAIPINEPPHDHIAESAAFKELKPLSTRIEGDLRPVVVRCDGNVAYFGKLEAHDGRQVWLRDARYLLSIRPRSGDGVFAAANWGIVGHLSRLDILAPSVLLLNAFEIINVSEEAAKSFEAVL